MGFDNLAPIIWRKIGDASLEVANGSSVLGKPHGRLDEHPSLLPTDVEEENGAAYSKPSEDLNVHQFLNSLLRAVVPA